MRVTIFCVLAMAIGCADGAVVDNGATGGSGGQEATGGAAGHVMAMTGTGGATPVDSGTDTDPPADAAADQTVRCPETFTFCTNDPRGVLGPGTCANLQTDIYNCGACFHACGGANLAGCQGGVCQ